jgi:SAM-dependent methyltransferase
MNGAEVMAKDLSVVGIDIDDHYIKGARQNCEKFVPSTCIHKHSCCALECHHAHRFGLTKRVQLKLESFYDHAFEGGRAYDIIHFASSFMLMPDQRLALQHVKRILNTGGKVIFAQTMEKKDMMGFIARYIKPVLTFFLRIDFGKVTYESDFYDLLKVRPRNLPPSPP